MTIHNGATNHNGAIKHNYNGAIDYNGRRFRPAESDAGDRVAVYRQDGDVLWGEFAGGHARRGALTGTCRPDGTLEFTYCMVLDTGELISGRCASSPRMMPDGRIQLDEVWERYGTNAASGVSRLHEILDNDAAVRTT